MSELRLRKIQLGTDTQNPENNITLETPPISDGTMKIRTGSAQGTGTDIFTFSNGQVENFNTNNLSIGGTQVLDSSRNLSNVSIAYDNGISGLSANSVQAALDELTVLTGGGNIGSQANFERIDFTATAGQTVFDLAPKTYDPGYIQVFLNGVLLASDEIVASNGTTVELVEPAIAGQLVSVVVLDSFDIATQLRVLDISASAPDDSILVNNIGDVGVGTTLPLSRLHVHDDFSTASVRDDRIASRYFATGEGVDKFKVLTLSTGEGQINAACKIIVSSVADYGTPDSNGEIQAYYTRRSGITSFVYNTVGANVNTNPDDIRLEVYRESDGRDTIYLVHDDFGICWVSVENISGPITDVLLTNSTTTPTGSLTFNTNTPTTLEYRGIRFPSNSVSSSDPHTLDDYEEGTWTPTSSESVDISEGSYIKIGRFVHASFVVVFNSPLTQNTNIDSLPFSAADNFSSTGVEYTSICFAESGHIITNTRFTSIELKVDDRLSSGTVSNGVAYRGSITYMSD